MSAAETESTAGEPAGDAGAGFGAALAAVALDELERAARQLQRVKSQPHRGVHQARKSLRRVRAILALAEERFGKETKRPDRRLRGALRSLSALRDAHVVLETLDRLVEHHGLQLERTSLRALRTALRNRRDAMLRLRLLEDPQLAGAIAAIERLREPLAALPWPTLTREDADAALARACGRAHRAGGRARAKASAERLHRWRRRLRRVRQQGTVLRRITGDDGYADRADARRLDALSWRQDLDVLTQAIAALASVHEDTRARLAAAIERAIAAVKD